jgi:HEPN domain-containing protein
MSEADSAAIWIDRAMSDLRVAKRCVTEFYPKEIYVAAGLSQQAAEKALKALKN